MIYYDMYLDYDMLRRSNGWYRMMIENTDFLGFSSN